MDITTDTSQALLSKVLDATALRHRVLTNNLANADTPGYIRRDMSFQAELADAVQANDLESFQPAITEDYSVPAKADGNNIALDMELTEIDKNALMHQMAIQLLQTKLSMQRMAIQGKSS